MNAVTVWPIIATEKISAATHGTMAAFARSSSLIRIGNRPIRPGGKAGLQTITNMEIESGNDPLGPPDKDRYVKQVTFQFEKYEHALLCITEEFQYIAYTRDGDLTQLEKKILRLTLNALNMELVGINKEIGFKEKS